MRDQEIIKKKKLLSNITEQKIWQKLILQNCLPIGKQAKFTSKNVTQYLLGSRNGIDFFKFNEIRHILLKITPLIETLFYNNIILSNKFGQISKKIAIPPKKPRDKSPERLARWRRKIVNWHKTGWINTYWTETLENKKPIKILFATITPEYAEIISNAAALCHMSVKTKRWLCGYISANTITLEEGSEKSQTDFADQNLMDDTQTDIFANLGFNHKNIVKEFETTYSKNKELKYKRYEWHLLHKHTHRPSLAIIPDIHNNDMILREIQPKNIPTIGLINSNCSVKVTYPIFGNADSIRIVHFFCHFLAVLIAKSYMQQEYKERSHRIFFRTRIKQSNLGIPKYKRNRIRGFRYAMKVNSKKFLKIKQKRLFKEIQFVKKTYKNRNILKNPLWKKNSHILWNFFSISRIRQKKLKLKKGKLHKTKTFKRNNKTFLHYFNPNKIRYKIKKPLINQIFGFLFGLKKSKKINKTKNLNKNIKFTKLRYFSSDHLRQVNGVILKVSQKKYNQEKKFENTLRSLRSQVFRRYNRDSILHTNSYSKSQHKKPIKQVLKIIKKRRLTATQLLPYITRYWIHFKFRNRMNFKLTKKFKKIWHLRKSFMVSLDVTKNLVENIKYSQNNKKQNSRKYIRTHKQLLKLWKKKKK